MVILVAAIAQTGRRRAIFKYVAMMAIATGTAVFCRCAEGIDRFAGGKVLVECLPEAGPAGAAVVFPVGLEQGQVAASADVGARSVLVVQIAAAGEFGLGIAMV